MIKPGWLLSMCLCAAAAAAAPPARTLQGRISQVIDGNTVLLLVPTSAEPLRLTLAGIDAPELCQSGGPDARDALKEWVLNQAVVVTPGGAVDKGRLQGTIMLDGNNINQLMVAEGQAWSVRVKWDQGPFVKQERMARALSRGLHSTPGAVMPRDFRRLQAPC